MTTTTTPATATAGRKNRSQLKNRVAARAMGLPRPAGNYAADLDVGVPTRDGAVLMTDHYWPTSRTADATVLIRTPYGRGFPGSLAYGATFAEAGYHVVIQSVRGTYGSSGSFAPFVHEADDAQDTVGWLRHQEWFNGELATVGGSYLGYTQWALQQEPPDELRAAVIIVGPHDPSRMIYPSGAFALADQFAWSEGVATQENYGPVRGIMRLLGAERRHAKVLNELPLQEAAARVLTADAPWYEEWLAHPDLTDPFWAPYQPHDLLQRTRVPTLLVGGWDDAFLDQTLEQYGALREAGDDIGLVVGPWNHFHTATKALPELTQLTLEWFDAHVRRPADPSSPHEHAVRLFVIGPDEWREYPTWPPSADLFQLHLDQDGRLSAKDGEGTSSFTYDPQNPTPSLGGRILAPRGAGSRDNRRLEQRADVITFTSDPLDRAVELLGVPNLQLTLEVDNPQADVFARLCAVDKRGVSRNLSDGFVRLDPTHPAGQPQQLSLELDPRAQQLPAGTRIRLQLSGGAHPRWARNLGSDEPVGLGRTMRTSQHLVTHSGSTLTLPVRETQ